MDIKNGKQYLPQTYEQFQQQKKKSNKANPLPVRPLPSIDYNNLDENK